jgi:hypothetical protein
VFCVVSHHAILLDAAEKLTTDVQVEDRTDSDRAKEADNESLTRLFNLANLLVHSVDDGKLAKKQDQ